jgi:hypothetical protein
MDSLSAKKASEKFSRLGTFKGMLNNNTFSLYRVLNKII